MGRAAEAGRVVGPPAEPGAHLRADVIRPRGLPCSSPDRNPPRRHRLTPPPESASAPSSPRLASLSPAARSAMPPECAPRPSAPPSTNSSRPASRQPPAGTTDASPMDPRGARRRNAARLPGNVSAFLPFEMKYHVEDHMFPMVPCHRSPFCTSGSGRTCPDPMHRTGRFMPNPGHGCDGAFAMTMSSFGGSFRPPFNLAGRIFTHRRPKRRRPKRRRHGRFRPGANRFRCADGGGQARVCSRAPAPGRVLGRQMACAAAAAA